MSNPATLSKDFTHNRSPSVPSDAAALTGRLLLSAIFIISGLSKLAASACRGHPSGSPLPLP
jgi:uncharacterized membrane protein YphA (DoxX/SURF4 family)